MGRRLPVDRDEAIDGGEDWSSCTGVKPHRDLLVRGVVERGIVKGTGAAWKSRVDSF
jgi:hypothetical protein